MNTIQEYMNTSLITVPPAMALVEVVALMKEKKIGSVVVKEGDSVKGIFTERDLLTKIDFSHPETLAGIKIQDVMTSNLKTVSVDEPYVEVIEKMKAHRIRHMPISRDGQIVGMVSLRDLLNKYQERLEQQLEERESELKRNYEVIRESEERFRTIFDNSAVAIMLADKNERIIAWNPFASRMLGMDQGDLFNKPVRELYPAEEWLKMRSQNIRQRGMKHHFETKVYNKQGELLDVDISISVLKDASGIITGSIGIMRDIRKRKELEKRIQKSFEVIRESESRFRTIFNSSAIAIVLIDKEERISGWNPYASDLLGIREEDLLGKPAQTFFPPEAWAQIRLQDSAGEAMKNFFITKIRNNRDELLDVEMTVSVLGFPPDDIQGYISIMQDITLRKRLQDELRRNYNIVKESEERFRTIFDNSAVAIMLADQNERIVAWNPFTESLLEADDKYLADRLVKDLYPAEEWERIREMNIRALGMKHHLETRVYKGNGELIDVDISISVLKDADGNITGSIGIIKDITARKQLEQMREEFVHTVSHEMRTPLTTIREGVSQVVEGILGDTTQEQRNFLSIVLENIDRLKRIIDDLLDMFKLELAKVKLRKEFIEINEVITTVTKVFQPRADEKGLKIQLNLSQENACVFADRDKLIQVFTNLVNNAIKFTNQGSITLSVEQREGALVCSVKDTGRGISQNDLPKVFSKFAQFGNEGDEKGTGLGLSITKKIVELHKGKIWVESTLHQGTTFYFTIPYFPIMNIFSEYIREEINAAQKQCGVFSVFLLEFQSEQVEKSFESLHTGWHPQMVALVKNNLRGDKDKVVFDKSRVLIILQGIVKDAAEVILNRVKAAFSQCDASSQLHAVSIVSSPLVSYPDDADNEKDFMRMLDEDLSLE